MDKNFLFIIIVLLVIIVGGTLIWLFWPILQIDPLSCIQEVKLCPDGSSVGRTGPNCEFAGCPSVLKPEENGVCVNECENKFNGTNCSYGIWCDEFGRICGGQSCVGLGLGKCHRGECLSVEEHENLSKKETADWLLYINNEYGFKFKYPKHWEYKEERELSQDIINDFGWLYYIRLMPEREEYSYEGTEDFPIVIQIVKNINLYNEFNESYSDEEKEELFVGGLPATNFITKMGESIAWASILTKEDNHYGYYFQISDHTHILCRTEKEKDDFYKTIQGVIDSFIMLK